MPATLRAGRVEGPDTIPQLGKIDHLDGARTPRIPAPKWFVLQRFHKPEMIASRVIHHRAPPEKSSLHDFPARIVPSPRHANNSQ
jgi:hypothetical protein